MYIIDVQKHLGFLSLLLQIKYFPDFPSHTMAAIRDGSHGKQDNWFMDSMRHSDMSGGHHHMVNNTVEMEIPDLATESFFFLCC